MQKRSLIGVVSLASALVLGSIVPVAAQDMVVKIAVAAPLSGPQAPEGTAILNGMQLAVDQLGSMVMDMGYTIEVVPFDDEATPAVGEANAADIVADAAILAVIGHFNSGVAIPSSVVYDAAGLVMVSPSNTAPAVTDRGLATVNRVTGRGDYITQVMIEFLGSESITSAYVVDDTRAFGASISEAFLAQAEAAGLTVAGSASTEDFAPVVEEIIAAAPGAVILAGDSDTMGALAAALGAAGYEGQLVGAGTAAAPGFLELAGETAVGVVDIGTSAAVADLMGAEQFATDFEAAYDLAAAGNAAEAYDATGVVLAAIARAAEAAGAIPTREAVATEVRATVDYAGLTGTINFDANGDRAAANYYAYSIVDVDGTTELVSSFEFASPLSE
ncbi:MAG: branched-chain amino acid ABC transporter substrate-binding protein [Chloroflexota bacterium]|nr:branched-chain amino acid ABC transporter substrate-binding protein [Chloroflexota bacterium]